MRVVTCVFCLAVCLGLGLPAYGQYKDIGYEVGMGGGITSPIAESGYDGQLGAKIRACLAYPLIDMLQGEFGYAYEDLRGDGTFTILAPLDLRLKFCPVHTAKVIPFVYAGWGMMNFEHRNRPVHSPTQTRRSGNWCSRIRPR